MLSLYWLLARLVDRRAGLYGAVILATMPLYFMQARTMLGDIVTMAAVSMAFAGLGVAAFDRDSSLRTRIAACVLGVAGLALGFMTRGLLIGVALPALGVGLTWAVLVGTPPRSRELFGDLAGAAALLVGATATVAGSMALFRATASEYSMWVGARSPTSPSFQRSISSSTTSDTRSFPGAPSSRSPSGDCFARRPSRRAAMNPLKPVPRRAASRHHRIVDCVWRLFAHGPEGRLHRVRRAGAPRRHRCHLHPRLRARRPRIARARRRGGGALRALPARLHDVPREGAFGIRRQLGDVPRQLQGARRKSDLRRERDLRAHRVLRMAGRRRRTLARQGRGFVVPPLVRSPGLPDLAALARARMERQPAPRPRRARGSPHPSRGGALRWASVPPRQADPRARTAVAHRLHQPILGAAPRPPRHRLGRHELARLLPLPLRANALLARHGDRGRGPRGGRPPELRLLPRARRAALAERGFRVLPALPQGLGAAVPARRRRQIGVSITPGAK